MRYTKTDWKHDLDDAPVLYISAFDDTGYEAMRVEVFRNGERRYADRTTAPEEGIWLANTTLAEVLALTDPDDEMFTVEIDQETFASYWNVAVNKYFDKGRV
ncbi:hypothetical protein L1281_000349 [Neisseria sp. HSC-16F19]|nr:hypothetical protein [Neisseria sp. HSC-16F19]MCP2039779.1 hypothetical protein [Neisseria sp. HSC-16F19]